MLKTIVVVCSCLLLSVIILGVAYSQGQDEKTASVKPEASLISIDRDNAPLREIFELLSSDGGLNFACSDEILDEYTVTVRMKNVPANEAAMAVARAVNLGVDFTAGGIAIIFEKPSGTEEEETIETR